MDGSRRRLPSPALLVACLALFVALGGTVLAATKISGRTIKVKSLPGNRLEVGSVPGNRIAPGSLKGGQIDVGTLGQVPDAAHATSADEARHAKTAVTADHATDASTINGRTVGCAEGQRQFAGSCWDITASANALSATDAAAACAAVGGELPEALALTALTRQPGIQIAVGGEWTRDVANPGASYLLTVAYLSESGSIEGSSADTPRRFRCVSPLLH